MTDFLSRRLVYAGVLVLAICLFAFRNLPWHLDDYDQAKQAFTSFEMVERGQWLYQHTPNAWTATKPPFVGWISAAFFAITRSWDVSWRLPSFLGALALLALLARAASTYGRPATVVAVSAFSFNLFTPRLATLVRTDVPLALIVFAIGWLVWEKIRKRESWPVRDRVALALLLTAAMLTKGPIVCAFLLPGIIIFQLRRRWTPEAASSWPGLWPWLVALALFLAWTIRGIFLVPYFWEHVVLREFAGRFDEATHQAQAFHYYLPHFLYRFAPWSILMIFLAAWAARRERLKISVWLRAMSPETFWLVAWGFGGLLALSLIPSKRVDRVFPIVPPLCLLLAAQVGAFRQKKELRQATDVGSALALVLAVVFTIGYSAERIIHHYRHQADAFAKFGFAVRQEAAAHGWSYEIVGGEDEGMALYLRRTKFLEPNEAVAAWNSGMLNGLVVPDDEFGQLLPRLSGAVPSKIGWSGPAGNYRKRYIFLVRP